MNQNYTSNGLNNPIYIPNQSTYPQINPQYAENLFSRNPGKKVTAYFSYPDSIEWRDCSFTGTILTSGRDYLLLKNDLGQTVLLWLVYINYAVFEGDISY